MHGKHFGDFHLFKYPQLVDDVKSSIKDQLYHLFDSV